MPFSAAIGSFIGFFIFSILSFVFLFAGLLVGADVDWKSAYSETTHDWFLYIGAAIGVIVGWLWLWSDTYSDTYKE